jgi:uncharacterized protein (TIGR02466 family)
MSNINFNALDQTVIMHMKAEIPTDMCKTISDQILTYKSNEYANSNKKMLKNSNFGCWRGKPHLYNGLNNDTTNYLIEKIIEVSNLYMQSLSRPTNIKMQSITVSKQWNVNAWFNVNEKGAENREHAHTSSTNLISGVFYFQGTGTGFIEFIPQHYMNRTTHVAWPYHGTSYYEPEDGDILLFPSYLIHKVHNNPIDRQRINMAFNSEIAIEDF